MKFIPLIVVLLFTPFLLRSQEEKNTNSSEKEFFPPSAISIFGIDFNDKLGSVVLEEFKSSYISNDANEITFSENVGFSKISGNDFSKLNNLDLQQSLQQILNDKKVGQQIISYWFNRQEDKSFNTAVFTKNGFSDLNEKDLIQKSKTLKGRQTLQNKGLKLINESGILVFNFSEIQSMDEFYKASNTEPENQRLNGFIADVQCYLLNLDFNGEVLAHFFKNYWVSENNTASNGKVNVFDDAEFPFQLKHTFNFRITSTQQKEGQILAQRIKRTEKELLHDLANLSIENALAELKNLKDPIVFKNRIVNTKPLTADVGEAGWLKYDQRYFVYNKSIDKNGKLKLKKSAAIKSNKVLSHKTEDKQTTFYQIAGKPIEKGMLLKEKNDIGINIYVGNALSGLPGYSGRFEYYISKLFGDVFIPGKTAKGASSIKIYLSGAGNKKDYNIGGQISNFKFRRGSLGISKDFYPIRIAHISPYVGYGLEYAKNGSPNLISSNFAEYGVELGINVTYCLQIVGSYNHFKLFKSVLLDEKREAIDQNYKYEMNFPDRKKSGFSLGLRIKI